MPARRAALAEGPAADPLSRGAQAKAAAVLRWLEAKAPDAKAHAALEAADFHSHGRLLDVTLAGTKPERVAAALNQQVQRDFGPVWGIHASVTAFTRVEDVPVESWPIFLMSQVQDAAGVHEDQHGQPFALVQMDQDWSLTASHEALEMLARIPETPEVHALNAEARLAEANVSTAEAEIVPKLDELLERVAADEGARQEYLDLLETLGATNPLTASYRKALAARLF
jgi:hypothetical protein